MKRFFVILTGLIILLIVVFLAGPRPVREELSLEIPALPVEGDRIGKWIDYRERNVDHLKMDNQARIIWFDDSNQGKTEYSVVYLHGFSASQGEGYPLHTDFAQRYGCNLFLARLPGHGVADLQAMAIASPRVLIGSAAEAIAVGKVLGEKVIVMSTSTGSTLSLFLAQNNPDIHSLIMFSPNIRLKDSRSGLIAGPWGLQIVKKMVGGDIVFWGYEDYYDSLYWTQRYPVESLVNLELLLEQTMIPSTFKGISQPVFLGYYYKNEEEQDPVVSVAAMIKMFNQISTPEQLKRNIAFPLVGKHVIASEYKSENIPEVRRQVFKFAEEILGLKPVGTATN